MIFFCLEVISDISGCKVNIGKSMAMSISEVDFADFADDSQSSGLD